MSANNRPAFLDALTENAVLTATVQKGSVTGRAGVTKIIETAGTFYALMSRNFHESIGNREFLEYDAELTGGQQLHGLIAITKNADNTVSHLSITQSPIESVIWLSTEMGKLLSKEYGTDAFL